MFKTQSYTDQNLTGSVSGAAVLSVLCSSLTGMNGDGESLSLTGSCRKGMSGKQMFTRIPCAPSPGHLPRSFASFRHGISLGGTRCTKALQSLRRQDPEADVTRNEITSLMSAATAFEPGTSIKDNAENHCGRPVVIALDVKDFFPSLKYSRVLALFRRYTETENARSCLRNSARCTGIFRKVR